MHKKLILTLLGIHVHCLGNFLVFGVVPPGRNMNFNINSAPPIRFRDPVVRGPNHVSSANNNLMQQRRGIPIPQQQQPQPMMKTNGPPLPHPQQNWRPRQEFPQQQRSNERNNAMKPCLNCHQQQSSSSRAPYHPLPPSPQRQRQQRDVHKPPPYQRQPPQRRSNRQVQGFFQIFPSFKEGFKSSSRSSRGPVQYSHEKASMFRHDRDASSYTHQIMRKRDLPLLIRIEFEVSEDDNDETQLEVVEEQEP